MIKSKRYRIQIITYRNGRQEFYAQVRKFLRWESISYGATETSMVGYDCDSREEALERIDLYFQGNMDTQTIEIEYITKP